MWIFRVSSPRNFTRLYITAVSRNVNTLYNRHTSFQSWCLCIFHWKKCTFVFDLKNDNICTWNDWTGIDYCKWWPTRCNYFGLFIPNQLYVFWTMSSPITRSTWLYLQLLILSTYIAARWCHGWDGTAFHLIHDTSQHQYHWTISDAVNTVKCSWW